jgi:hypothetical protein
MTHLLSTVSRRWGFHYDAAILLALGLCSAFAVARHAERPDALRPQATTAARPAAAVVNTPAASGSVAPAAVPEVWPRGARFERLAEIGRGKGIVFSPDFAARGNRRFYERLGFAYFEGADWRDVLARVRAYNRAHAELPVETLILEAHGTNGNGLKLQAGAGPRAARSYVSVGGLQQQLAGAGLRLCVIAACNSGRLFRPEIYYALDTHNGDPLFLPATRGVVNATPDFHATERDLRVVYPATSRLEAANEVYVRELAPPAVALLYADARAASGSADTNRARFVVSDAFIAMLFDDSRLGLTAGGYVEEKSAGASAASESESLVQRFISLVNETAAREYDATRGAGSASAATAASAQGR